MLFAFAFAFLLLLFCFALFYFCGSLFAFAFCYSRFAIRVFGFRPLIRCAFAAVPVSLGLRPVSRPRSLSFLRTEFRFHRGVSAGSVFCIHYFKFRNSSARISLRGEALLAVRAVPAAVSGSLASQIHLGAVLLEEGLKDAEHMLCLVFVFHEFIDSFFFVLAGHIL